MRSIALLSLIVSACATMPSAVEQPAAPSPAAPCDAAPVQDLVGKPLAAHHADAQQRANAGAVRVYESGSAVTMDYRADRLNIETDASGTIVKLTCG